jgi:hypothetical protein
MLAGEIPFWTPSMKMTAPDGSVVMEMVTSPSGVGAAPAEPSAVRKSGLCPVPGVADKPVVVSAVAGFFVVPEMRWASWS